MTTLVAVRPHDEITIAAGAALDRNSALPMTLDRDSALPMTLGTLHAT